MHPCESTRLFFIFFSRIFVCDFKFQEEEEKDVICHATF